MSRGHGTIINYTSWASFIFIFNPESIESEKKINYATAPNIGGGYKKRYFTGFDAKQITFNLFCVDKDGPTGVMEEIAFFEQLREPDPGIGGIGNSFFGNANYPPPQVLFQFASSYIPLIWDVLDVGIKAHHFHSGQVRGVLGIPKMCDISITLGLVEDHKLNKANQIAKKVEMYAGAAKSLTREVLHGTNNTRKEMPGIFTTKGNTGFIPNKSMNPRY